VGLVGRPNTQSGSRRRQPATADHVGGRVIEELPQGTCKTITTPTQKFLCLFNHLPNHQQQEQGLPLEISDTSNPFWVGVLLHLVLCEISPG
jgi:hypothetical protein